MTMSRDEHQKNLPVDNIDEYDVYYGEQGTREDEKHGRNRGPLGRRPAVNSAIPAILLSFLFLGCTFLFNNSVYSDLLWVSGDSVFSRHEYWRLVTALFTHSGPEHLFSNLPFFIFFGLVLYEYFGFMLFPALSILIGTIANLVTVWIYDDATRLIGASGMVYGMVALWLVLYVRHDTGRTMLKRIFMAAGFTLAVMFPEAYYPSTSYLAHGAGFIIGMVCGFAVLPFTGVKFPPETGTAAQ